MQIFFFTDGDKEAFWKGFFFLKALLTSVHTLNFKVQSRHKETKKMRVTANVGNPTSIIGATTTN